MRRQRTLLFTLIIVLLILFSFNSIALPTDYENDSDIFRGIWNPSIEEGTSDFSPKLVDEAKKQNFVPMIVVNKGDGTIDPDLKVTGEWEGNSAKFNYDDFSEEQKKTIFEKGIVSVRNPDISDPTSYLASYCAGSECSQNSNDVKCINPHTQPNNNGGCMCDPGYEGDPNSNEGCTLITDSDKTKEEPVPDSDTKKTPTNNEGSNSGSSSSTNYVGTAAFGFPTDISGSTCSGSGGGLSSGSLGFLTGPFEMITNLLSNELALFVLLFIFFFILMYGIFAAALTKVAVFTDDKNKKPGKMVALSLAMITTLSFFGITSRYGGPKAVLIRFLSVFELFGGMVLAAVMFLIIYYGLRQDNGSRNWKLAMGGAGMALLLVGSLICAPTWTSIGMFLMFIALLVGGAMSLGGSSVSEGDSATDEKLGNIENAAGQMVDAVNRGGH